MESAMDIAELVEPFVKMLDAIAGPAAVRAAERGEGVDAMWCEVAQSGFLDTLVAGAAGGAGLPMSVGNALWQEVGRRAVPLPIGETMIARGLLAAQGRDLPEGPIVLAVAAPGQRVTVPLGLVACHALVDNGTVLRLVSVSSGAPAITGAHGDLSAILCWSNFSGETIAAPPHGLRCLAAVLRAALIAGAADRLVEMTAAYANERVQFGKPIGRQQALQQNIAVMAEDAVAARIASQLGCRGDLSPSLAAAATAKSVAGAAAARIAATAHAVHGAIGISEECDLQLLTRRLLEWRLADGSETYWNRHLGALRLGSLKGSVDFVREALSDM